MRVRYSYEARYPFPPGRESGEVEVDTDDIDTLPPLLRRDLRTEAIEDMFDDFRLWEYGGATLWYWTRPTEARP